MNFLNSGTQTQFFGAAKKNAVGYEDGHYGVNQSVTREDLL